MLESNVAFFSPSIIIYLPKNVSIWEKKDRTWEIIMLEYSIKQLNNLLFSTIQYYIFSYFLLILFFFSQNSYIIGRKEMRFGRKRKEKSMRSFDYSYLSLQTWDNEILSYVAKIHEYKGKQELYLRQKPVELERLVEVAKVQSTESSNRIEGIITTKSRLQQLVEDKTTPRNRDEKKY